MQCSGTNQGRNNQWTQISFGTGKMTRISGIKECGAPAPERYLAHFQLYIDRFETAHPKRHATIQTPCGTSKHGVQRGLAQCEGSSHGVQRGLAQCEGSSHDVQRGLARCEGSPHGVQRGPARAGGCRTPCFDLPRREIQPAGTAASSPSSEPLLWKPE